MELRPYTTLLGRISLLPGLVALLVTMLGLGPIPSYAQAARTAEKVQEMVEETWGQIQKVRIRPADDEAKTLQEDLQDWSDEYPIREESDDRPLNWVWDSFLRIKRPSSSPGTIVWAGNLFTPDPNGFLIPSPELKQLAELSISDGDELVFEIELPEEGVFRTDPIDQSKASRIWSGFVDEFKKMYGEEVLKTLLANLGYAAIGAGAVFAFATLQPVGWILNAIVVLLLTIWLAYNIWAFIKLTTANRYEELGGHLARQLNTLVWAAVGSGGMAAAISKIPALRNIVFQLREIVIEKTSGFSNGPQITARIIGPDGPRGSSPRREISQTMADDFLKSNNFIDVATEAEAAFQSTASSGTAFEGSYLPSPLSGEAAPAVSTLSPPLVNIQAAPPSSIVGDISGTISSPVPFAGAAAASGLITLAEPHDDEVNSQNESNQLVPTKGEEGRDELIERFRRAYEALGGEEILGVSFEEWLLKGSPQGKQDATQDTDPTDDRPALFERWKEDYDRLTADAEMWEFEVWKSARKVLNSVDPKILAAVYREFRKTDPDHLWSYSDWLQLLAPVTSDQIPERLKDGWAAQKMETDRLSLEEIVRAMREKFLSDDWDTNTVLPDGRLVPWLAAQGDLSFDPRKVSLDDPRLDYQIIMPGVVGMGDETGPKVMGARSSHSQDSLFGPYKIVFFAHGSLSDRQFQAPCVVYQTGKRFYLYQQGRFIKLPNPNKKELRQGYLTIYRGIRNKRNYSNRLLKHLETKLSQKLLSFYFEYLYEVLSNSTLSFGLAMHYTSNHATDHIEGLWSSFPREVMRRLDSGFWDDPRWDLAQAKDVQFVLNHLRIPFTVYPSIASDKFGPNHIVLRTPLTNVIPTSDFVGEGEVNVIDPRLLEVVETHGVEVVETE